jgi:DNA-binding NarL/FixJ family response regulator
MDLNEPTDRQLQVLAHAMLLGEAAAAHTLGITQQTVKNHLAKLYRTIGVRTRDTAAVSLGWLHVPAEYSPTDTAEVPDHW